MDQGSQRQPLERIRRLPRDRVPEGHFLSGRPWTGDDLRVWSRFGSASPLYAMLVEIIATDPELLRVMNRMRNTPPPNILLAGVQFLLMADPAAPLAAHYPNIGGGSQPRGDLAGEFRAFVLGHEEDLVEIGRTRFTQTNECRRCAVLLPLIWLTPVESFHLVDIGTSAGLNLHLDRYRYSWGGVEWGPPSPVLLETENRGDDVAPRDVDVMSRTGLDLNPVDPGDPEERRWLDALIWPEHEDRRSRLAAALEMAARNPVRTVAGDALETMAPVLGGLPPGEPVIVMHSFALIQFSPEERVGLREVVQENRRDREVYEVSFDTIGRDDGAGGLAIDDGSGPRQVGLAHPHGEWLELYARP